MTKPSRKRLTTLLVCLGAVWGASPHVLAQAPIDIGAGAGAGDAAANDGTSAESIIQKEEIERQRKELDADTLVYEGREALIAKDYAVATQKFTDAEKLYKEVSRTNPRVVQKQEAVGSLIASTYEDWADTLVNEAGYSADASDFEKAKSNYILAMEKDPSRRESLMGKIQELENQSKIAEIKDQLRPANVDPEYINREERILLALEKGKVFAKHGQLMRARDQFELVLTIDPGNDAATVQLERLYDRLHDEAQNRRMTMLKQYVSEIEWKWIDPIPPVTDPSLDRTGLQQVIGSTTNARKLKTIIIPKIKFEETLVKDVVDHLRQRSVELDPDGAGINILLILDGGESGGGPAADEADLPPGGGDDFLDPSGFIDPEDIILDPPADDPGAGGGGGPTGPTITMEFSDIPLGEAIRYLCTGASTQLDFKVEEHAVIIFSPEKYKIEMETQFFSVPAGFFTGGRTREVMDSPFDDVAAGEGGGDASDVQDFFTSMGVKFPAGASVTYNPAASKVVVTNTSEELRKVEKILSEIIRVPSQITIEAKFVEVVENRLKEVGFDWIFDGGPGGDAAGGRIGNNGLYVQPSGSGNSSPSLTSGLSNAASAAAGATGGNLVALNGILGGLQFRAVIHALDQSGGVDVLSAPKVTTMSGQTANVRLVDRRRLVEEYTEPEVVTSSGGQVSVSPPTPVFGEEQRFGIQLTVTPTVGDDDYTIDLELNPTVTEFIQYDNVEVEQVLGIDDTTGEPIIASVTYQSPLITERSIETRVLVYDGETVVLGGTIEDRVTKNNDRVPFFAAIPLIGRMFQSDGEYSEKTNLLIFVSARLVRPNGLPKRPSEIRGLPDYRR